MGDGSRIERITMVSLLQRGMSMSRTNNKNTPQRMHIHRPINPTLSANKRWTTRDQRNCHLRGLPHDPARQGISTSNLGLSTTLTPILQLSPIASYRLEVLKRVVNQNIHD